ncbi:KAP family P-loop NTPase fold protein [Fodinibius salsisoli]|uniref:AAA family ATPase n=1 Tax=Fodinibius salsisoli TaxID=2820877 RepID=A0ABT3PLZ5_9BACT|nr:P-loop NTPase fold protein [Fodinibius salsisoli]MCW9706885.1 AAA family ATPase [Fodinibius salsisoli]
MKYKRIIFFLSFILFASLLLKNWFHQEILNQYIVPLVFDQIEPTYYLDVFFMLSGVSFIILFKEKFKRKFSPSPLSLFFSFWLVLIYSYYRFIDGKYFFIETKTASCLAYGDILLLFGLIYPVLYLYRKFKKEKNKQDSERGFNEDNPIEDIESDLLGRKRYAKEIAERIVSTQNEKSFAIGVVGQWGTGKTSFLELIKKYFEKDDLLIFDYNPWNITGSSSITSNFFETFSIQLETYSSQLSNLVRVYSAKLGASTNSFFLAAILEWINLLNHRTKESLYDEINQQLKEIDKKIIIFIDDLDRLDNSEIIEVVKLIRNSANFYRTVFIVSYDRNYLLNAVKKINESSYESFLEKIFQLEVTLPRFEEDIILSELENSLKDILTQEDHEELVNQFNAIDYDRLYNSSVSSFRGINIPGYYLETLRDVTRFINLFSISYSQLQGEVYIEDLFYLEILRLKHPNIHELIFERSDEFFETTNSTGPEDKKLVLKENEGSNSKKKLKLCEYLNTKSSELHISEEEIEAIKLSLKRIFWRSIHYEVHSLSVVIPSNFNKYFSYRLLDGDLSEIEFSKARKLPKDEFFKKIDEWICSGFSEEVERKLALIKNFDNKEDFEKVISSIFYYANKKSSDPNSFYPFKGFNVRNIYNKMYDHEDRITKGYYSGEQENYKEFVYSILNTSDTKFNFQIEFLHFLNTELNLHNFPLDLEERTDFLINYLEKYLEETDQFNLTTWKIYITNKRWYNENKAKKIYPERSKELLKQFIKEKATKSYFEFFINEESSKYYLGDGVNALFDDMSELKKFVKELEVTPISREISHFLNQLKGEKSMIEFDFKNLDL